ncbi:hypothetical protein D3C81_1078930 [compost metagenome]
MAAQNELGDTALALGQQRTAKVVQGRVNALLQNVLEAPGTRTQPGEVLAQHRQYPGGDAREQITAHGIELVGEGQRHRQALPWRDLEDVVELILQVRMAVERLVVLARFELVGRDIEQAVAAGADLLHAGAIEGIEQIEPREVATDIAFRLPGRLGVLFEQRRGHAGVRIEVHGGGLDGPDHAERAEQGGGEARLADRLGDRGHLLEPLF